MVQLTHRQPLANFEIILRDSAGHGVLEGVNKPRRPAAKTNHNLKMKLSTLSIRLLLATTLFLLPFAGFAADAKMADNAPLMEPVKSVLDHYLLIQAELAKDSINGVATNATAIVGEVRGDQMKMLSADVATEADALAKAADLPAAREAFKPLSQSLIKYLTDTEAGKGTYHEAYCPMVRASWLQTEPAIRNPYLGREMLTCGEFKN